MPTGSIELSILVPAFLAGLLVLSTHVPMGQQVLGRGIVFIDLSIAQVAGLGVTTVVQSSTTKGPRLRGLASWIA